MNTLVGHAVQLQLLSPGTGSVVSIRRPQGHLLPHVVLAGVVTLLLIPATSAWCALFPVATVWLAATALAIVALYAFVTTQRAGENPWVFPAAIVPLFFFYKYGWGTLVIYYWNQMPWSIRGMDMTFDQYAGIADVANASRLVILGGIGLLWGCLISPRRLLSFFPDFHWPMDERRFRTNLVLYSPIALLIFTTAGQLVPVALKFFVLLFGWIFMAMMILISAWLFATPGAERLQLVGFVGAVYGFALVSAFSSGMTGEFLYPGIMIIVGYAIYRKRLPWTFLVTTSLLLAFVIFPWIALYKQTTATDPEASASRRSTAATGMLADATMPQRLELVSDRYISRMAGTIMPAIFLKYYPDVYPFQHGASFFKELSSIVPRVAWPDKPNVSMELNQYSVDVGLVPRADGTSAVFDAIAEYYLNFGDIGVLVLCILHGCYLRFLYGFLTERCHYWIGAAIWMALFFLNLDFFGVVQLIMTHSRIVPVWLFLFYVMGRRQQ